MDKAMYALWRSELKEPTPDERRHDRTTEPRMMSGFWRINAARTKPDFPVAIWTGDGEDHTVFQIGQKRMRTDTHAVEWQDFLDKSWLKCTAVEQTAWGEALQNARWGDGKMSREQTAAEKADIIPTTAASSGGNEMVDENGDPIDADWLQIKNNLERDIKALGELGAINSLKTANKAAEIIERMRANSNEGEARRKAEKKPFDDGAAAVQAKWVPVLGPASEAIKAAVAAIEKFKKAEEKRLRDEAEAARRAEAKRIAEEEAEKIRAQSEAAAAQARSIGLENVAMSEEQIQQEAEARAAEAVQAMPQQETNVRVGTAHGRGVSKATVWGGEITDLMAFFDAIKDHVDTVQFLQKKADALGRAKATVPGMRRVEK